MFDISDLFDSGRNCSVPSRMIEPEGNKRDKRIFGLELEANDRDSWGNFSNLVYNNIICIPHNLDDYERGPTNIVGKYDCTAQYEIVLQAERPRNIFKAVKSINTELSPETVNNVNAGVDDVSDDCSAHIHINNAYLYDKGIEVDELIKAAEILAPYLYVLSDRNYYEEYSMYWAKSILERKGKCDIFTHPKIRAKYLDEMQRDDKLSYTSHSERYCIMNAPTRHKTSELRLFTNICSFDYNKIKLFIEIADLLIDIADEYQGINYTECWEEIIMDFAGFMNRYKRRQQEIVKSNLMFLYQGEEGYKKFLLRNRHTHGGINLEVYKRRNDILGLLDKLRDIERRYGITYNEPIKTVDINTDEIEEYIMNELLEDSSILSRRF